MYSMPESPLGGVLVCDDRDGTFQGVAGIRAQKLADSPL